jgi:hypothetical protein
MLTVECWKMLKNLYLLIFSLKIFKKIQYRLFVNVEKSKNLTFCLFSRKSLSFKLQNHWRQSLFKPKVQTLKPNQWEHIFVRIKKTQVFDLLKFVSNLLTNACNLQTKLIFNIEKKSYKQMSVSYGRNFLRL